VGLSLAGTPFVQQKPSPLELLTATVLAAAVLVGPAAAEDGTDFGEYGPPAGYGAALPYRPGSRAVVPGPPIPPTQASRPASWPGTPAAPKQWDPQSSRSRQGWAAEYPRSSPGGYPGPTTVPTYPRTAASPYDPPPCQPGQPSYQPLPYDLSQPPIYQPLPYDPSRPPNYHLEPHRPARPPEYPPPEPYGGRTDPSPGGYSLEYPQMPNALEPPYPQMPNAVRPPYPQMANALAAPRADRDPEGQPPAATQMEPCEGAQILARVGSEVILASEVLPAVDQALAPYKDRIPSHQLQRQRRLLIEQQLMGPVETKLIYLDARRSIPEENLPRIEETLSEQFEKSELKKMMKQANVETRRELDRKLRSMGTSLQRRKQAFIQRTLAQSWAHQQLDFDEEITYDQMLEYYRRHLAEFQKPARARWEELMVRFSKHPGKADAYAAAAQMGNQVLAGAAFAEVARSLSDGTTAAEGGLRDWTRQNSLVCEALDRALFGLPVGRLSPILESENGLHIIRVTQREPARCAPFLEAQVEIRPKIREQRAKEQLQAYVARLKKQIPVWTIFDDQARDEQLSGRDGRPRR